MMEFTRRDSVTTDLDCVHRLTAKDLHVQDLLNLIFRQKNHHNTDISSALAPRFGGGKTSVAPFELVYNNAKSAFSLQPLSHVGQGDSKCLHC